MPVVQATSNEAKPLRVCIVGAGIGGLALAAFMSRILSQKIALESVRHPGQAERSFEICIYDSSPSLTEVGAGVGMWLRTWRIMQSYGSSLVSSLTAIAPVGRDFSERERDAFVFRRGDDPDGGTTFYTMKAPFGVLTLHRASLQQVLASQASPSTQIFFGKRMTRYVDCSSDDGPITVHFDDDTSVQADLLVGADGIHSSIRHTMYENMQMDNDPETRTPFASGPLWTGTIVYRALINWADLAAQWQESHRACLGPVVYFGKNKHVIAFPILTPGSSSDKPNAVNLVAFSSQPKLEGSQFDGPWMRPVPQANLLKDFEGWEPEVMVLLKLAKNPTLWAIHNVPPLPSYADQSGRVLLIGDSAHAMTPHQGAGGGQAIEDAHVLAHLLAHPDTSNHNLHFLSRAYDTVRRPIAVEVARRSRLTGMMYELNHAYQESQGERESYIDAERLEKLASAIVEIHDWEWTTASTRCELDSGKDQICKAIGLFEGMLLNNQ